MFPNYRQHLKSNWRVLLLAGLAILFYYGLTILFASGCAESGDWTPTPGGTTSNEIIVGCCSGGNPKGYYKINDDWDPTRCGEPTSIDYNVCTYQRYDNKAVGAKMTICRPQNLAPGWVEIETSWDPTSCGHPENMPTSDYLNNIQTVRRDQ